MAIKMTTYIIKALFIVLPVLMYCLLSFTLSSFICQFCAAHKAVWAVSVTGTTANKNITEYPILGNNQQQYHSNPNRNT